MGVGEKARAGVRSVPVLHHLLRPVVRLWRRGRRALVTTETDRFRRCVRDLPDSIGEPVFVKVGANDGLTNDPCSDLLLADRRWTGLLVEPVPYCMDRLRENFPDRSRHRLEQVAVGASPGQTTFYYVDPEAARQLPDLPPWFDQLGSFDRNHIVKHLDGALEPFIRELPVEVLPLTEILSRAGITGMHLLHVDTEGYDYEVLKTLDFTRHHPQLIYIEHRHLSGESRDGMLALLRENDYEVIDCGADYFAIHRSAGERLRRAAGVN